MASDAPKIVGIGRSRRGRIQVCPWLLYYSVWAQSAIIKFLLYDRFLISWHFHKFNKGPQSFVTAKSELLISQSLTFNTCSVAANFVCRARKQL